MKKDEEMKKLSMILPTAVACIAILGITWTQMKLSEKKGALEFPLSAENFTIASRNGNVIAFWDAPFIVILKNGKEIFRAPANEMGDPDLYLSDHGDYLLAHCRMEKKVLLWNIVEKNQIPFGFKDKNIQFYRFEMGGTELNAYTSSEMVEVYKAKSGKLYYEFNREGILEKYLE